MLSVVVIEITLATVLSVVDIGDVMVSKHEINIPANSELATFPIFWEPNVQIKKSLFFISTQFNYFNLYILLVLFAF